MDTGEEKLKYFHFRRTPLFYIGLLCVVSSFLIIAQYVQSPYSGDCSLYNVNITLTTDQAAGFELYYDVGREFNERDKQETTIDIIGEKVNLQFTIPVWTMLEKVRLDPVGAGLKIHVYELTVSSADSAYSYDVSLDAVNPGQQIINGYWDGSSYSFETLPDANDPILMEVGIDDPHLERNEKSYLVYVLWGMAGLCITLFCNWIFRFFILGL